MKYNSPRPYPRLMEEFHSLLKTNVKPAVSMVLPIFIFAAGFPLLLSMPVDLIFPIGLTLSLGLMEMFTSHPL